MKVNVASSRWSLQKHHVRIHDLKGFDCDLIRLDSDVGVSSRYFLQVFGWICFQKCCDLFKICLLLVFCR